ncbi:unnamed protein product [Orchesella dallaii]|uniref:Medium-chain specific acyl-CoA dehydrogenase, mitochondrial n=1 Tax=Orchesella dallaii TaxID=48710 RepID=A0ABP1PWZ5_9HEXA
MDFPMDIVKKMWNLGILNPLVLEKLRGPELGCLGTCIKAEEIVWACTGVVTAALGNSLATSPVLVGGNGEQKKKYVGRLISEPVIPCYCVTEAGAGSGVSGLKTRAKEKEDERIINDTPGISVGRKEINMGQVWCSDTSAVTFEDVRVPKANMLAEEGIGFKIAMASFDKTQPQVAAGAVGLAQRALDEATKYTLERKSFGTAIVNHQVVAFMLADMAIGIETSRQVMLKAAWELDQGEEEYVLCNPLLQKLLPSVLLMLCKFLEEMGLTQVTGYSVEKLYRDSKLFQIYEGTTQIQKTIVSREVIGRFKNS